MRKRTNPAQGFGIPPPFDVFTGEFAKLRTGGVHPYCAMMQVAAEDTYANYVICRGFDPRMLKFIDYEAGNADKPGISVAKPYGTRVVGYYQIGQVHPALLPTQGTVSDGTPSAQNYVPPSPTGIEWRLGQNPGKAATTAGHPATLNEAIQSLTDHNDKSVQWMLIDSGAAISLFRFTLNEDMGETTANEAAADLLELDGTDTDDDVDILDPAGVWANAVDTAAGLALRVGEDYYAVACQLVKPLCAFTLDAALATTEASKAATITAQYGPGMANATAITVHNQRVKAGASTYIFEGASGAYGLAEWDSGTNYRIINLECPA